MAQACAYLCCHSLDELWWLRWILTKWCIKTAVCVTIPCFGCLLSLQNNLRTCQVNADRSRRCLCDYQLHHIGLQTALSRRSANWQSSTCRDCELYSLVVPHISPAFTEESQRTTELSWLKTVIVCCFCEASRMGTLVWRWVTVRVKKNHLPLLLASGRGSGHVSLPVEVCVVPGHAAYTSTKLERYKYTFQDITTACLRGNLYVVWLWHGHDHTPVYFGKQIHI